MIGITPLDCRRAVAYNNGVAMREALETLKMIQAHDQQVRELQRAIRSYQEHIARLEEALKAEEERVEQLKGQLGELQQRSRERNAEVDDLDEQLRHYRQQLDHGLLSFKEMEALRHKVTHDQQRIEQLEDEALALMDEMGQEEVRLQVEQAALSQLGVQTGQDIKTVESQIAAAEGQISQEQQERVTQVERVPALLLERYQRLARDYSDPLVPVVAGSCGGCKLKLSETTLSRLREGLDLIACENCSRILISRGV